MIENCSAWAAKRRTVCPDRLRRKVPISRPSQTEISCVQIFLRTQDFCLLKSRLSCVHWLLWFVDQTFVCSPNFGALMFSFSYVHQIFMPSPDFISARWDFGILKFTHSWVHLVFAPLADFLTLCLHFQTFVSLYHVQSQTNCNVYA